MTSFTSAIPSWGRAGLPAKITSVIWFPRRVRGPCSPSTHEIASTTLDLPDPFGPDHDGDARGELEDGFVREGLESTKGQLA